MSLTRPSASNAFAAIVIGFLASVAGNAASAADVQIRAAEIVAYGIFEPSYDRRLAAGNRANAPRADSVSNVTFTEYTNDIPGVLGISFGYQFVINSSPKGGKMEVVQVIHFPGDGLQLPNGRVYTESRESDTIKIGEPNFYGYGFDQAWEIIPGDWIFEVWYQDARIIRKTFTVLAPEKPTTEVAGE